jgi:hypothetical protein
MREASPLCEIIDILNEIIRIVRRSEIDVVWSGYDTTDDVLSDLTGHIGRLTNNDLSRRKELKILFAPTGPLQEIALSSGWGDQFLSIAERFDQEMKKIVQLGSEGNAVQS